jgi:hypothetical protein
MYYLIYTSTAIVPPTEADMAQILLSSDRNNGRNGITGLLLYHLGSYVQLLEGDEAIVTATFNRIARDPRHYGIRKLGFGNSDKRYFPDWRMAFEPVDDDTVARAEAMGLEEAGDFIQHTDGEHLGIKLLRLFYQMKMGG